MHLPFKYTNSNLSDNSIDVTHWWTLLLEGVDLGLYYKSNEPNRYTLQTERVIQGAS